MKCVSSRFALVLALTLLLFTVAGHYTVTFMQSASGAHHSVLVRAQTPPRSVCAAQAQRLLRSWRRASTRWGTEVTGNPLPLAATEATLLRSLSPRHRASSGTSGMGYQRWPTSRGRERQTPAPRRSPQ